MYWLREIAGWLLILVGLFMFYEVYLFLQEPRFSGEAWIFEAFILMIPGIFVFRGGIHLLKVAMAARICTRADERLYPAVPERGGKRGGNVTRS